MTSDRPIVRTMYADGTVEERPMNDDEYAEMQERLTDQREAEEARERQREEAPNRYKTELERLRDAGYTDDEIRELIALIRLLPEA